MPRPPADAPADASAVLTENRRRYELVVSMARHYADQGDVEHLLRAAMLAGQYAFLAPIGLLSDLRLERMVVDAVRGPGQVTVDGGRRTGRVLHVLSEAHSVGGHTRLAWRWIDRDPRSSDLVLTNQDGPVPAPLADAVAASGGEVHGLRAPGSGLLERAFALRRLMDRADLVVLHVNPYDSVALAAVNLPGTRPPVVFENHADLSFWLGVASADLLCDLRAAVRPLDVDLRGVPAERIDVLPMPIEVYRTPISGAEVRRALEIPEDAVVALTVSDDWKVTASWGRGMAEVVDRVLARSPQLVFVLVGVRRDDDWARLEERYPDRVLCVGRVPDPAPYFAAADLYLESYPTRAGTTPLEAAVLGLPVVALADAPAGHPVRLFQANSPGLDGRPVATTPEACATAVRRLVVDPARRAREGAEVRDAVRAVHDGPGWRAGLEALYARARSLPAADVDTLADSVADERYGAVLLRAFGPGLVSPDPRHLVGPLGDLYDRTMHLDLLASLLRDAAPSLQVRVAPGWHRAPAWTGRLLALAAEHRHLTVSLPFADGDDAEGSASVAALTAVLAGLGQSTDDCGDICLESTPSPAAASLDAELSPTPGALDELEALLSSPCWQAADLRTGIPAGPVSAGSRQ